jgi:hypothetical protein
MVAVNFSCLVTVARTELSLCKIKQRQWGHSVCKGILMPTRIAALLGHFTYSSSSLFQCSDTGCRIETGNRGTEIWENLLSDQFRNNWIFYLKLLWLSAVTTVRWVTFWLGLIIIIINLYHHHHRHYLTSDPQLFPKRVLHRVRSSVFSLNLHHPSTFLKVT